MGGIRERKSGREDRSREWRDGLTLFCQLTPADLSSRLPIKYGAFKVASSRALYCMCIWAQHKRSDLSQLLHRVSVEYLHILCDLIFHSAKILAAVSDFGMVGLMVSMRLVSTYECHEENHLMISPRRV